MTKKKKIKIKGHKRKGYYRGDIWIPPTRVKAHTREIEPSEKKKQDILEKSKERMIENKDPDFLINKYEDKIDNVIDNEYFRYYPIDGNLEEERSFLMEEEKHDKDSLLNMHKWIYWEYLYDKDNKNMLWDIVEDIGYKNNLSGEEHEELFKKIEKKYKEKMNKRLEEEFERKLDSGIYKI